MTGPALPAGLRILGVDPGGRYAGLVLLAGAELVHAEVIDRRKVPGAALGDVQPPLETWARHVADRAIDLELELGFDELAVEGVKAPTFHGGRRDGAARVTNPTGIIECAAVFGAIVARFPRAVVVPPGGNGSAPVATYPTAIGKGARLGGPSEHARSAFDVAARSRWELRLRKANRP